MLANRNSELPQTKSTTEEREEAIELRQSVSQNNTQRPEESPEIEDSRDEAATNDTVLGGGGIVLGALILTIFPGTAFATVIGGGAIALGATKMLPSLFRGAKKIKNFFKSENNNSSNKSGYMSRNQSNAVTKEEKSENNIAEKEEAKEEKSESKNINKTQNESSRENSEVGSEPEIKSQRQNSETEPETVVLNTKEIIPTEDSNYQTSNKFVKTIEKNPENSEKEHDYFKDHNKTEERKNPEYKEEMQTEIDKLRESHLQEEHLEIQHQEKQQANPIINEVTKIAQMAESIIEKVIHPEETRTSFNRGIKFNEAKEIQHQRNDMNSKNSSKAQTSNIEKYQTQRNNEKFTPVRYNIGK